MFDKCSDFEGRKSIMFMSLLNPALAWLGVVILLLVIELATMGLTTIWFAGGAMAAFISTFFGASPATQRTLFLGLSLILLIFTRPAAVKYINRGTVKTNADSVIGKIAVVKIEINNLTPSGEVTVSGIEWTARSKDDLCRIPVGKKVKVCAIEGVKLIVEEIKED